MPFSEHCYLPVTAPLTYSVGTFLCKYQRLNEEEKCQIHKKNRALISIAEILAIGNSHERGATIRAKRDEYGRLHSPITNMNKELRSCLVHEDGSELVNLDVRSSQPFFLGIAVWKSPVSQKMKKEALRYLKMLSDESYDLYVEVVKSCDNLSFLLNQAAARDLAKKEVMHALYKNKYTQRANAAEAFFKREFPLIFSWVRRNRGKGNKSKIPTLMQRKESDFFVGHIMPLLHAEGIWCLTIHDSIVVKKNYATQIKRILEKEFMRMFGVVPCIRIEPLKPSI